MSLNKPVNLNRLLEKFKLNRKNKILIINNNVQNIKLLKRFLKKDYQVELFNERSEVFVEDSDLIIIDEYYFQKYQEKLKRLRESKNPIFLPIVLLSSSSHDSLRFKKLNCIYDDIFMLPIKKQIMKHRLNNLLKIRKLSLKSEYRYYELAEKSPIGIFILNQGRIIYANPAFLKILKTNYERLTCKALTSLIYKKDKRRIKKILKNSKNSGIKNEEIRVIDSHQQIKWLSLNSSQVSFNNKFSVLITAQNITDKKENQNKIRFLNYHDKLTGLYNRNYLEEEIKRLNTIRQLPISVIMGNVNGLKLVNDAFGHQKGNQLLKSIASVFKNACRAEDIIARWGGDEFVILLPRTSIGDARKVSNRIRKLCAEADKNPIKLSIALGVAQIIEENQSYEEVFKKAEDRMYRNKIAGSESASNSIILSLENTLLENSHETKDHAERMNRLVIKFAEELNLSTSQIDNLKLLSRLHDIGKVSIPEKILKKPGKLSNQEYKIVKNHPESGYRIVKSIPELASVAEGVLSHHERWDGGGYPQGLFGEDIPYTARIITIIDSYDVMTHQRSYKTAMTKKEALAEIEKCSGSQFDPYLAGKFIEMIRNQIKTGEFDVF